MALINSKKKRLQQGEIIVNAVIDAGLKGQEASVAMSAIVAEATQPNTYTNAFGNTLFICHADETKQQVFLRVINVDVYKNLERNVELFISDCKKNGIKTIVYADPDTAHVSLMEKINKSHLAVVQMERSKKTGWYVFVIQFPENMKAKTQQPEQPEQPHPQQ